MDMANQLLGTVLYNVLYPGLSRKRREGGPVEAKQHRYLLSHFLVSFLMAPGAVLTALLAPEIVEILLGPRWAVAGDVLRILGGAMYFRLAYKVSGAFVTSEGAVYRGALIQAIYAGMVVIGAYLGAHFGLIGVAVGVTIALLFQCALLTGLAGQLCQIRWSSLFQAILPNQIVSVVSLIPALFLYSAAHRWGLHAASTIALVGACYLAVYLLLSVSWLRLWPISALPSDPLKGMVSLIKREFQSSRAATGR
jgi:PST family polysaccharide transporter